MTLEKERKLTMFKNLIVNYIALLSGLVDLCEKIITAHLVKLFFYS